jgi:phosphatidylglycerophosphatase A
MGHLAIFLATCGRIGFIPVAPGTFGSAAGVLVYYGVRMAGSTAVESLLIAAIFAVGCWAATEAGRQLGSSDPGPVVLDEVLGMLITLWSLPVLSPLGVLAAFLLFRILDIVKPYPANRLEALPAGLGVMADDAMAGVYGNLIMRGLIWLLPGWVL